MLFSMKDMGASNLTLPDLNIIIQVFFFYIKEPLPVILNDAIEVSLHPLILRSFQLNWIS